MPGARRPGAPGPRDGARDVPALHLDGIAKRFGAVQAVCDVSLSIRPGTVTGIVGENGAGKSTLMNIAYGLVAADAGTIRVAGEAVRLGGPLDAIRHGIGMVHQHFMLVDTFSVLDNVVLGAEGGLALAGGRKAAREKLRRLAAEYGLSVDPDAVVGELPVGDQQRVEILKALSRGARVLILDEPTAVLTPAEADGLFAILRGLAAEGVAVVLITHKLREIAFVTDDVVVMRAGRIVASGPTRDTTPDALAEAMVGRKLRPEGGRADREPGPVLLEAVGVSLDDGGVTRLHPADLRLRAGEILGVAGVSGNGQSELIEILAGLRAPTGGALRVGPHVVTPGAPANPAAMRRLGVAHVPEDRHRYGMVGALSAAETAILGYQDDARYGRGARLDGRAVRRHCAALMERFDVRPRDPALRAGGFSGGNQQKLVLGREVAATPRILLVGQPTRGVDIGAIATIHRELRRLRDEGCAILLVSAELDEILALSDRIAVLAGGRIVGTVAAADADERALGLLMAGIGAADGTPPDARPGRTAA